MMTNMLVIIKMSNLKPKYYQEETSYTEKVVPGDAYFKFPIKGLKICILNTNSHKAKNLD